jgi:hypothetical protein
MTYAPLLNLRTKHTVMPVLTADDWQLYTSMDGAEEVAKSLNTSLAYAVNLNEGREYVETFMGVAMRRHDKFGAFDTEPRYVLQALLNVIYPEG